MNPASQVRKRRKLYTLAGLVGGVVRGEPQAGAWL